MTKKLRPIFFSLTSSFALESFTPDSWIYKKRGLHKELSYNTQQTNGSREENKKKKQHSKEDHQNALWNRSHNPQQKKIGPLNEDVRKRFITSFYIHRHQDMFIIYDN